MERRTLLRRVGVAAVGAGVAGCLEMNAEKVCGYVAPVEPADAAARISMAPEEIPEVEVRASVREAIETGEASFLEGNPAYRSDRTSIQLEVGILGRADGPPVFIAHAGQFVEMQDEMAGGEPRERWMLRAQFVDEAPDDREPTDVRELGEPKRSYVSLAIDGAREYERLREDESLREEWHPPLDFPPNLPDTDDQVRANNPRFTFVFRAIYQDPQALDLVPTPEPEYVRGQRGEVVQLRAIQREIRERRWRIFPEHTWDEPVAMMEDVAPAFSLSDDEREIFEAALDQEFESESYGSSDERPAVLGGMLEDFEAVTMSERPYAWIDEELYRVFFLEVSEGANCDVFPGWPGESP